MTIHPRRPGVEPRRSTFEVHTPDDDRKPLSVDETRLFYRETSTTPGGMKMNWVDYIPNRLTRIVEVIYSDGYRVELSGRDAFQFLRMVRDKSAPLFDPSQR